MKCNGNWGKFFFHGTEECLVFVLSFPLLSSSVFICLCIYAFNFLATLFYTQTK